jgi:hypothetical protein
MLRKKRSNACVSEERGWNHMSPQDIIANNKPGLKNAHRKKQCRKTTHTNKNVGKKNY